MKRRILIYMVVLSTLSVIVTSAIITAIGYSDFFRSVRRDVKKDVTYLQDGYGVSGEAFIEAITPTDNQRITLVDSSGEVLYDSEAYPQKMSNHLDRPEIQSAVKSGSGEATRTSNTIREKTYYYAVQLSDGKILRLSHSTSSIFTYYTQFLWMVLFITICVIIVTIIIGNILTKKIIEPINTLDLNHPEATPTYEELTPLIARIKEQNQQIVTQMNELNQSKTEFEAITENMSEGFILLDKEAKILSYNKSSLTLLNIDLEITQYTTLLEVNRTTALWDCTKAALNGTYQELILDIDERSCQIFISPVFIDDNVHGAVLLVMDITEKQERDKLRREFTANVSHELKTPLTSISGYAEVLSSGMVESDNIQEFAGYIYTEAQRLILLINDLMLLSKLEESSIPQKEAVDLYTTTQAVIDRLSQKATKKSVELHLSGESSIISGIPSVIEEMIYNLTDNAIKYNKVGGKVTLDVTSKTDRAIVSISDTGKGIPKSEQNRIFERFYRIDRSHNGEIEGSGLGLAIVKHGALLHQAKITLESDSNGSDFSIEFKK